MFEFDSTPVIVNGSPVLVLDVGYMREAEFIGGNLTNSLEFRYTVRWIEHGSRNQTCDTHTYMYIYIYRYRYKYVVV